MPSSEAKPVLWYFADPMCSWCWGFSPVIHRLRQEYGDRALFALNLGGLRPGTTTPISDATRNEILHHWHQVHAMTGQPFQFEGAMPEGFVYDTEPAARAVVVVGAIKADAILDYFTAIQQAFYAQGRDVTREDVLQELSTGFGIDADEFAEKFSDPAYRERTQRHFDRSRQAGVRGFPTVYWQHGDSVEVLCRGCVPYEQIAPEISDRLNAVQ